MGRAVRHLAASSWAFGWFVVAAAPAAAEPARVLKTSVADAPAVAVPVARLRIHGRALSSLKLQSASSATAAPPAREHDGDTEIDVAVGTQMTVRSSTPEASVALRGAGKRSLSGQIFVGTRNAETGRATVWSFQPVVLAKIVPLQWDPTAKAYLTTIEVGLDGDKPEAKLIKPVTFEVLGEHIERVDPDQITITAPGPGGYTAAKILTTHYVPSVKISVHSLAGDAAFEADVDPGLTMALTATQSTIPAFGLGATVITLSCRKADGTDGSGLAACSGHHIPTTTLGRLEPTDIELKASSGAGQVTLYSASAGITTITVDGLPALHIELVWPWSLFLAGLFGAVIGAGLRLIGKRKKGWRGMLVGSIVTGVLIDVLLTLGIPLIPDLRQGVMTTEAGWFALGGLGGLLGTQALVGIAKKLFGAGGKAEPAQADAETGHGDAATKPAGA